MRNENPRCRHRRSKMARRLGTLGLALMFAGVASSGASPVVLDETLDMVCFPPAAMTLPPCPVPVGVDPAIVAPDPSGEMRIRVRDNDKARMTIQLSGMSPYQVATAWFVHFPPGQPPPDPIFAPIGPGQPPVAHMDTPVARTDAAFTEGLGKEPNEFRILPNGKARLVVPLDYNPLKSQQVPLVNGMVPVNQGPAPAGSVAEQSTCCMDFPAGPQLEPVGGSYLRQFDPVTGFQVTDSNGRPELIRSPSRPVAVAIIIHIDSVTSGILPGIPTPPFLVNPPVTTGSFYLLGIFPLGPLGMD